MIPFLTGLLYFLIFLFVYVCVVMLISVLTELSNPGYWLLFSPIAAVVGFAVGFVSSRRRQNTIEQEDNPTDSTN